MYVEESGGASGAVLYCGGPWPCSLLVGLHSPAPSAPLSTGRPAAAAYNTIRLSPNWVSPSLSPACRGQTKAVRPSFRPTLQQQPLIRRTLARPQGQVRPPMEDLPRQKYVIVHAIMSIIHELSRGHFDNMYPLDFPYILLRENLWPCDLPLARELAWARSFSCFIQQSSRSTLPFALPVPRSHSRLSPTSVRPSLSLYLHRGRAGESRPTAFMAIRWFQRDRQV